MSERSIGLGDTVKKVIEFFGLHKLVTLDNCGCERRRHWLNTKFPYPKERRHVAIQDDSQSRR
jgi:hypothetical protein